MSRYWNDFKAIDISEDELCHFGVLCMKCGVRRYQNKDDTLAKIINDLADADTNCNYIFHTENLKPLCPTSIDYVFKQGIKKSGVKKIRVHDLRHSHAS